MWKKLIDFCIKGVCNTPYQQIMPIQIDLPSSLGLKNKRAFTASPDLLTRGKDHTYFVHFSSAAFGNSVCELVESLLSGPETC